MTEASGWAVKERLSALEAAVRAAGDNVVGDCLHHIFQSSNQLLSLRRALVKKPRHDAQSERYLFFSQFKSSNGASLSWKQTDALVAITSHWEPQSSDLGYLKAACLAWRAEPQGFCKGAGLDDDDVIRRCFNELLVRMHDEDGTRRKVLMMVLSEAVEARQQRIFLSGVRKQSRKTDKTVNRASRNSLFLTSSLKWLTTELWGDLEKKDEEKRRERLSRFSLYGWKWRQLKPKGIFLTLGQVRAQRFERRGWYPIEIEAVNKYITTLAQFKLAIFLGEAWVSITVYYFERRCINTPANNRNSQQRPVGSPELSTASTLEGQALFVYTRKYRECEGGTANAFGRTCPLGRTTFPAVQSNDSMNPNCCLSNTGNDDALSEVQTEEGAGSSNKLPTGTVSLHELENGESTSVNPRRAREVARFSEHNGQQRNKPNLHNYDPMLSGGLDFGGGELGGPPLDPGIFGTGWFGVEWTTS